MKQYKGKIRGLWDWNIIKLIEPQCFRKRYEDVFYDPNKYNCSIEGRYKKMSTGIINFRKMINESSSVLFPRHCFLMLLKEGTSSNLGGDYLFRDNIGRNKMFTWGDGYTIYNLDNYYIEQKFKVSGLSGKYDTVALRTMFKGALMYSYKNKIIFDYSMGMGEYVTIGDKEVIKVRSIMCPDVSYSKDLLELLRGSYTYMGEIVSYDYKVDVIDRLCLLYGYSRNSIHRTINF